MTVAQKEGPGRGMSLGEGEAQPLYKEVCLQGYGVAALERISRTAYLRREPLGSWAGAKRRSRSLEGG